MAGEYAGLTLVESLYHQLFARDAPWAAAWFERNVLPEHAREFPRRSLLSANPERNFYSEDRWTNWRPPFIALRLLTYSSGRCQR
jgi:hypothetical protein